MQTEKVFGFNASAIAFGGLIRPAGKGKKSKAIKGMASAALSPTGGIGESIVKRYNEDGISFRDAVTTVEGSVERGIYKTIATVQMERLSIFDRVKCDAMQAILQSRRDQDNEDASFTIQAKFEGLRIDRSDVKPPLNFTLFKRVPTYADFIRFFSDENHVREFGPAFGWMNEGEDAHEIQTIQLAQKGDVAAYRPIRCSLLTSRVDTTFTQDGYSLKIPGFGRIHLAEVLVKPGRRRINMLRIEAFKAGSPSRSAREETVTTTGDTYDATFCSGEGNGSNSYPP